MSIHSFLVALLVSWKAAAVQGPSEILSLVQTVAQKRQSPGTAANLQSREGGGDAETDAAYPLLRLVPSSRTKTKTSQRNHMYWHLHKPSEVSHNNLAGFGPVTSDPEEIRYFNVSRVHNLGQGESYELDLKVTPVGAYHQSVKTDENGRDPHPDAEFGMIWVKKKKTNTFKFEFVKSLTDIPVVVHEFDFTIFHIDQSGSDSYCCEHITGWLAQAYAMIPTAYSEILLHAADRIEVCSSVTIKNGEMVNPDRIHTGSIAQARASVMLSYRNTSSFLITMTNNCKGPRPLIFAGTSDALSPPNGTWYDHFVSASTDILPTGYSQLYEWILHAPAEVVYNNLGGRGPVFTDPHEIRYRGVGLLHTFDAVHVIEDTVMLDLVVTVEGEYWSSEHIIAERNGANGHFGEIGVGRRSETVFLFTFVETDTYIAKVIPKFEFSIFDIDNMADPTLGEQYFVHGASAYSVPNDTYVIVDDSPPGMPGVVHLTSNVTEEFGAIPKPDTYENLTENQSRITVMFEYRNTSNFKVEMKATATTERAFLFAGHSSFRSTPPQYVVGGGEENPAAFGDPHLTNLKGSKFNIERASNHLFLVVPRGATTGFAKLEVYGEVTPRGANCSGQLYLTKLTFAGEWLRPLGGLELSTRGEGLTTRESISLRVGRSEVLTVEEFASRMPPKMANITQFQPEQPTPLSKHATILLVRLYLGPLIFKTTWEYQKEKIGFSNSLMLTAYGLRNVQSEVGGLLGVDDHTWAATPAGQCQTINQRSRPRSPSRVLASAWLAME